MRDCEVCDCEVHDCGGRRALHVERPLLPSHYRASRGRNAERCTEMDVVAPHNDVINAAEVEEATEEEPRDKARRALLRTPSLCPECDNL